MRLVRNNIVQVFPPTNFFVKTNVPRIADGFWNPVFQKKITVTANRPNLTRIWVASDAPRLATCSRRPVEKYTSTANRKALEEIRGHRLPTFPT